MNQLDVQDRLICPACAHSLIRIIDGDAGDRVQWKTCVSCGAKLGPPWPENQWSEPSSEPVPSYAVLLHRASCLFCEGPLTRVVEGEAGNRIQWKTCGFCGAKFGPPWPEHQWSEPSAEPIPSYTVNANGSAEGAAVNRPSAQATGGIQ